MSYPQWTKNRYPHCVKTNPQGCGNCGKRRNLSKKRKRARKNRQAKNQRKTPKIGQIHKFTLTNTEKYDYNNVDFMSGGGKNEKNISTK